MNIIFSTNIDAYRSSMFPSSLKCVPRKGEYVEVIPSWIIHMNNAKLPIRLEVVSVTYREIQITGVAPTECYAIVELHYNKTDLALSVVAGGKPF